MKRVLVFDPPMCCSTGVCGPGVDPQLVAFASELSWLERQGVAVTRFNLGQEPQEFAARPEILAEITDSTDALPIVQVDGTIRSRGRYPGREELAAWCEVALPTPSFALPMAGQADR